MYKLCQRIILAALVGVLCSCSNSDVKPKTIKVGAAINLTGPASTWGQFHAKGQQDYLRYVNEV